MAIRIKNPRVVEQVRMLADELGVGLTEAIQIAVRFRLRQLNIDIPTVDPSKGLARAGGVDCDG